MDIIQSEGYKKLLASVTKDTEGKSCFGSLDCPNKCFHNYCEKLRWIVDRAKHYSEKTGLEASELLDAWEKDRKHWYMNYYQEANQPTIKDDNVRVFDTEEQLVESLQGKGFTCPACGSTINNPYECNSGVKLPSSNKTCDWKSYGLFGHLGKGVTVFVKSKIRTEKWFMPVAWQQSDKTQPVEETTQLCTRSTTEL